jgi:multidrug resistance protein
MQEIEIQNDPFLVDWEVNDPRNPKNWSKRKKWICLMTLASGALCATCASSIYTGAYQNLDDYFQVSRVVTIMGLSFFVFGLAAGPLWLAPMSEFYGRNLLYIPSFILFGIWQIPAALAPNMVCMIIVRFLAGFCSSAFLSTAGGSLADLFSAQDLHFPMAVFTTFPLTGPTLGPVVGGFINYYTNWQWTFWVMLIWVVVEVGLIIVFLPETYGPLILRRMAKEKRKKMSDERYYSNYEMHDRSLLKTIALSCTRPFALLFCDPMIFVLNTQTAFISGILYLFFESYPLVFGVNHGFNLWQVGLCFSGIVIGVLLSIPIDPIWTAIIRRQEKKTPGKVGIEYQLPPILVGSLLTPIGLFWFAFTSYPSVHWIWPILASIPFALGVVLSFQACFQYFPRAYPQYAASAMASNTFWRCFFAGGAPFLANPLYEALGNIWATALLAFIALALAPFPFLFFYYGPQIRARSRFSSSKL